MHPRSIECSALDHRTRGWLWRMLAAGTAHPVAKWSVGAHRAFLLHLEAYPGRALTPAEQQIARLVGAGRADKEIAFELGMSRSNVARAVASARSKLGVESRLDLAILAALLHTSSVRSRCVSADVLEVGGERYALLSASFDRHTGWGLLSAAERAVVALTLAGRGAHAISHARAIAPRTIANHLASAFRKLDVSGRAALPARLLGRTR